MSENMNKITKLIRFPSGAIIEINEGRLRSLTLHDVVSPELLSSIQKQIKAGEKTKEGEFISLLTSSGRIMQIIDSIVIKIQRPPWKGSESVIDLSDVDIAVLITYIIMVITNQELLLINEPLKLHNKKFLIH